MKSKNDFKKFINDPRGKIIFKFILYGIFFIVIYAFAIINTGFNPKEYNTIESSVINKVSYLDKLNKLKDSKLNIKYQINDYYIEGIIIDNVLTGTLENIDGIIKIKYDGLSLYRINKNESLLDENLLIDINKEYLLVSNIINILSKEAGIKKEDYYEYNLNEIIYLLYFDENQINKIIIKDNDLNYELMIEYI